MTAERARRGSPSKTIELRRLCRSRQTWAWGNLPAFLGSGGKSTRRCSPKRHCRLQQKALRMTGNNRWDAPATWRPHAGRLPIIPFSPVCRAGLHGTTWCTRPAVPPGGMAPAVRRSNQLASDLEGGWQVLTYRWATMAASPSLAVVIPKPGSDPRQAAGLTRVAPRRKLGLMVGLSFSGEPS